MNAARVILTAVALLLVAVSASSRLLAPPASSAAARRTGLLPPAARAGESTLFGHIKSLTRKGGRFEMRFDPAWWLTGVTAERAKLEDTGSSVVANDYYIVEEGHRLLTYVVPATAHVTVLTQGIQTTAITVSALAQIVKRNKKGPGFWIRISPKYPSPVLSIDQQYQP